MSKRIPLDPEMFDGTHDQWVDAVTSEVVRLYKRESGLEKLSGRLQDALSDILEDPESKITRSHRRRGVNACLAANEFFKEEMT